MAKPKHPVLFLHLEDDPRDADLIKDRIEVAGLNCEIIAVDTQERFEAALTSATYDVILCDYNLPDFNGLTALQLARRRQPTTPVIMVSGALSAEEAVACLQQGATDYLLKQRLERLGPALKRALAEAEEHREFQRTQQMLTQFKHTLDQTLDSVFMFRGDDFRFIYVNKGAKQQVGYTEAELLGMTPLDIKPEFTRERFRQMVQPLVTGTQPSLFFQTVHRHKEGFSFPVEVFLQFVRNEGQEPRFVAIVRDITERKRAKQQSAGEQRVLELLARGAPLSECLDRLARESEAMCPGMMCSVLLLDADGRHLRHGAAPSLPADYNAAIDGIEIGPGVGSCGTAAHTGRTVIVSDIATDPLWADFKELAQAHGLRACWSVPILGEAGRVLGTFALYYPEPRAPQPAELATHERAAHLASLAILRNQNLDALRRSEARLQEAQGLAKLGSWEFTPATSQWIWSDQLFRIFQLDPAQGVPSRERILALVHPDDRAAFQQFHDLAHPVAVQAAHFRLQFPDGSQRWIEDYTEPDYDQDGRLVSVIGTTLDITARAAAEEQIREQADLLNKARDVIFVAGLDNRITFWNESAERITGWPAAEVLGKPAEQLFGTATTALIAARESTMTAGAWHGEIPLVRKDGQPVVLDLRVTLIRDHAGQPKARLSIGTDITEKKQLEEQSLRAQRYESLGMLAAGIAHDFNNILSPLIMAAPLLKPQMTNERDRRMLATIEKSGTRGAALVRQILSFATGVSGGTQLLQARHVLKEVAELAESTFPKSIQFGSDLPGDLWPVTANAGQLHQVFLNLCINARDAMPQGGTLRLRAANRQLTAKEAKTIPDARPGAFLVVEVADTGTGIPPEILEHIWEPFFTTKDPGKGTGLGLSTVRALVHQHGGFIALQSRIGHGTVFSVFLPAAESGRSLSLAPLAPPILPRGDSELILVVDDEEPLRDMITLMLTQHGYRVLTAGDGAAALTVFAAHADEVRLLLTDFQMPLLGGSELTTAIHRIHPGLPVIVMSGASSRRGMSKPHFAGAFIPKPFSLEILLPAVHQALHRPSSAPPA